MRVKSRGSVTRSTETGGRNLTLELKAVGIPVRGYAKGGDGDNVAFVGIAA